jgi:hypothetical protein
MKLLKIKNQDPEINQKDGLTPKKGPIAFGCYQDETNIYIKSPQLPESTLIWKSATHDMCPLKPVGKRDGVEGYDYFFQECMGDFSGNHLAVEGKVLDWRRIRKGY